MQRTLRFWLIILLVGVWSLPASAQEGCITVTVPVGPWSLENGPAEETLSIPGYGRLTEPGVPRLPVRLVAVAVPPGAEVIRVEVDGGAPEILAGSHRIAPAPVPRAMGEEDPAALRLRQERFARNQAAIYGTDEPYPDRVGEPAGTGSYRRYDLVNLRISPIRWHPLSGRLLYHSEITARVYYRLTGGAPSEALRLDRLTGTEALAQQILLNHDQARDWYPPAKRDRGLHPLVIVTTEALEPALAPLVEWEGRKGNNPAVVTMEWIRANVPGGDDAARLRAFLRERYPAGEWGIESVLLAGHWDDVPMREIHQGDPGPLTDFYYAELSLPDDESWDSNGNRLFGEDEDEMDLYPEVRVGRIPWSDPELMASIAAKSVAFEQTDDPAYKQSMLLLGSFVWAETDAAVLCEMKFDQPWMEDWSAFRLYEQNETFWSDYPCDLPLDRINVRDTWRDQRFSYVNAVGHGWSRGIHMTEGYVPFFNAGDCRFLDDGYPAVFFAAACSCAETEGINLGMELLRQGGVGFVGATRVAYGVYGWDDPLDGEVNSLDYYFTLALTSGEHDLGSAHQQALLTMIQQGLFWWPRFEVPEWTLHGVPTLGLTTLWPSDGTVELDRWISRPEGSLGVVVTDADLDSEPQVADQTEVILTTSGGDRESLSLVETGLHSTRFEGSIPLAEGVPEIGNGRLESTHGEIVTATYTDADDGRGGRDVPKQADCTVDGVEPEILDLRVEELTEERAVIRWETDEPADVLVRYGTELPLDREAGSAGWTTEHSVELPDLEPCTTYLYEVESVDQAGNRALHQGQGSHHELRTLVRQSFLQDPLDADPGWTIQGGDWAFGRPTGQGGGTFGQPDPTSGATGEFVYGYNLDGDYPDDLPAWALTTTPLDCTGQMGVQAGFQRWLGVEGRSDDQASLQVSAGGGDWVTLWENPGLKLPGGAWERCIYDLSPWADGQPAVRLRWIMGPTDGGKTYCGWNIDDLELTALSVCSEPPPTPRPTWTPVPGAIGLELALSKEVFQAGDRFRLTLDTWNEHWADLTAAQVVLLAAGGEYWFHPGWTQVPGWTDRFLPAGTAVEGEVLLDFIWPVGVPGGTEDLWLVAALLDPETADLVCPVEAVSFGWR